MKIISPILSFMIASAGIHIALVVSSNSTNIILPGSTGSVMAVKIEEKKHVNAKQIEKIPSQKKHQPLKKHIVKKAAIATTALKNNTQEDVKEATAKSQSDEQQNASRSRIISIIYSELNQYFTYPKLAVRRNWQGNVLLSLHISSTGKIENIQLSNSSGYDILDQAAISTLIKVGTLPDVSSWLDNDIDLQLPITYKLIEG